MPVSELRLIKRCVEFVPIDEAKNVPHRTRGVYVLFKYRPRLNKYDVVYIGMAGGEKKDGLSINQVANLPRVKSNIPRRTVYAYLSGEKDSASKTVSILLGAVGLTITTTKRAKRPRKEQKK